MLLDGLQLIGSSTALNLTVDGGVSLPTSGNYQGELFFLVGSGLHVFDGTSWLPVGKEVTNSAIATALGYTPAALDESGKLSAAQLPAIAITDTSVVSSQAAMLALTAEVGDVAVRTDNNKTYILKAAPAAMLENWVELAATTATLATLTSTQIGYGSASNTLTGTADLTYDSANRILTVGAPNDSSGFTIRTPASASATAPPALTLSAGNSTGTAQGGNLSIYSGSSDAGNGGNIDIRAGYASANGRSAGHVGLQGGNALSNASGAGGTAYVYGGAATSPNAAGGTATLAGGASSSTQAGGQAEVFGGNNSSSGPGGNVLLRAGNSGSGTGGSIVLNTYASGGINTERLRITSTGAWGLGGASNYGTAGQVLTSNGNAPPTWSSPGSSNASNLSGGSTGDIPFQSAANTTSFASFGSLRFVAASSRLELGDQNTTAGQLHLKGAAGQTPRISTGTDDVVAYVDLLIKPARPSSGGGGLVTVSGGDTNSGSAPAGGVTIVGGGASSTGTGTGLFGPNGPVLISGGPGHGSYPHGGGVTISGGSGNYAAGWVTIQGGTGTGSNGGGGIIFNTAATTTLTERLRITNTGAWHLAGSPGTAGQVLRSNGDAPPTWTTPSAGATLNATQIGYGSAGNALTGSADLTYDSANRTLTVGGLNDSSGFTIRTPGSASGTAPPSLTLQAGHSTGTAQGGNLSIYSGSSDAGNGGHAGIQGGTASTEGKYAGNATLVGGSAATNASGAGQAYISGGSSSSPNAGGGTATLTGGTSSSTLTGGQAEVTGGNNTSSGPGGNVLLRAGYSIGGTGGSIILNTYASGGVNTERLRITSTGAWALAGATNYGTSGQVLTSNGNAAPSWAPAPAPTLASTHLAIGSGSNTITSTVKLRWIESSNALTVGTPGTTGYILASLGNSNAGQMLGLAGSNSVAANGVGGAINLSGGAATGTAKGGDVILQGGGHQAGGTPGEILFYLFSNASTNSERLRIRSTGAFAFNGATNFGTSGQVLTSSGDGPPTWSAVPGTALTSTQIGYGSNSNTVTGNSSFTYDAAANGITMTGLLPRIIGGSSSGSRGTFLIRGADQPNGNNVLIRAGTADGTGGTTAHGGYLLLQSGAGSGSNAAGDVIIQTGTGGATTSSSYSSAIKFSTSNTSSTLVERFRITNTGAWSVGADGTAYGTSGQVLTSNGNAPPTWSAIPTQTITLTGDVTGSGTGSFATTLASVGTAGTYRSVTTDAKGRVTAGTNPTTLAGYGITDALDAAQKGAANGLATLGADSKIPTSQLPALAITDTFVVASEADMLALAAQTGDVAVRTDLNQTFILTGDSAATLADWQELLTPTDTVLSVNGQTGAITLTTTDIAEGTNLYYTNARASAAAPVQSVAGRTGAVTLTSSDVAEGTNQYYTDARARGAISVTGNGSYDAGTGAITINAQAAADASTLTGTTLASNVVTSSLTSVGTLTNLTVTNPIAGSITGNAATVTTNANLTGDVTSVGNATTLASVGTAGTYRSVTTDAKGRVTAGTNPTTLAGYGITDAFSTSGGAISGNVALTGNLTMTGNIVPSADITYDLGSPTMMWRDIYVGPGSIYMNGQKILENVADTIIFTADIDQNVRIETSGTGNLELQTGTGGAIIVKGPLQITAGRKILSTDGIKVEFGDDIDMSSNKIINLGTPVNAGDVATKGYVDALTTTDSTLVRTTGNQTIAGDKTFTGTTVIQGNLTVSGTTTTVNAETVTIADNILELNSNFTSGEPTEDSGIQIRRGDLGVARFIWDETADRFTIRTGAGAALDFYTGGTITATSLVGALTGNATTATALATSRSISITGDATWTVNFNGSANATGVLTLADVATSGTYRSVTVDTKGRITGGTNPTTLAGYGITDAVTFVNGKSGNLTLTTSDIAEGTRLYYTDERVRNAISVTGNGSYDVNSDVITINAPSAAAAGTLTGTTLASNVVTSSLTSVGTLTSLAVAGTATAEAVNINGVGLVFSSTLTTTATTANQVVATASAATYRAVKFQITVTAGSAYHYTEVSVLHNGTDTFMTETGTLSTGASLATFSSTLIGGNIQLLTTPTNAASTYKVIGTAIAI